MTPTGSDHFSYRAARIRKTISNAIENAGTAEVADFAQLIEYVAEIPGIERIRYTTSHPNEMTPRLIAVYGRVGKLVSHLHLPVQSGSDRMLAAMKARDRP